MEQVGSRGREEEAQLTWDLTCSAQSHRRLRNGWEELGWVSRSLRTTVWNSVTLGGNTLPQADMLWANCFVHE